MYRTIYIEESARHHGPALEILKKYPSVPQVLIRNYKDLFNRPRQNQRRQAQYPALILATKTEPFMHNGPAICQHFGVDSFYYASLLLNCPFDCAYCFLQGMYPSKYVVAFVNLNDYIHAIREKMMHCSSALLALSYDTDLVAFESVFPYVRTLSDALKDVPGLTLEFRTKSAATQIYKEVSPAQNIVFAFSLSPHEVAKKIEHQAPRTESRLQAAQTAIEAGHRIRLCFDPVFIGLVPDQVYIDFYEEVFTRLPADRILDVSHGFFRMNRAFYKTIAKARPESQIFAEEYVLHGDVRSYAQERIHEIRKKHLHVVRRYVPQEKIFTD